jgi:hypothetical protein
MRDGAELSEADFFDRVTLRKVVDAVASALHAKTGFSLLRLGDGEGPILCWPDYQLPEQLPTVLSTWFGPIDLPDAELSCLADGLRQAVRSADVLGLPTRFQLTRSPRYGMVFEGIGRHRLCTRDQLFADSGLHWYLQWSGALAHILRGVDAVSVIGCRDLGPRIAETFNLASVRTYLVRGEHHFPGSITVPHWPDGFNDIMKELDDVRPGSVFLVGAGVLGKIYCDRIKAMGGIALDVGSILDSWAMIPSREPFKTASSAFTLDHFKTVPPDWDGMTAALHRWKNELHARDQTTTL